MPTNRAERRMRLKQYLSRCHRMSCLSGAPGAGHKACVFDLLCVAGNNEKPFSNLSKLHSCIVLPRGRLNALPGERLRAAGFHLPECSRSKKPQTGTLSLLCRQTISFQGFSMASELFGGPHLYKAPCALHCLWQVLGLRNGGLGLHARAWFSS